MYKKTMNHAKRIERWISRLVIVVLRLRRLGDQFELLYVKRGETGRSRISDYAFLVPRPLISKRSGSKRSGSKLSDAPSGTSSVARRDPFRSRPKGKSPSVHHSSQSKPTVGSSPFPKRCTTPHKSSVPSGSRASAF